MNIQNRPSLNRTRRKSRGQSVVELALVLPLMVLLLALAADFGRAFTAYIQIGSAAREGAAFGMQSPDAASNQAGMRAAVLAESPTVWGVEPEVAFPSCSDDMVRPSGDNYQCVAVRVDYDFSPLISFWIIPDSIPMSRVVEMRVIN